MSSSKILQYSTLLFLPSKRCGTEEGTVNRIRFDPVIEVTIKLGTRKIFA
jgi:hypothetical protein